MTDIFFSISHIVDQIIMIILVFFSILMVGISIERYFVLRRAYRKSLQARQKLRRIFQSGNLNDIKILAEDDSSLEGRAMSYALKHIKNHGPKGLTEVFNSTYLQEKPVLEGSISVLATIGSNAPFVGLLGTVFGIMRSFHDLGLASSDTSQQAVMAGISVALFATAMGLAVAIPSVIFYNYFRSRVNACLETLENVKEACLAYSQCEK